MIDPSCFLVLDLDDTLYPEVDYQNSGFRAVGAFCERLFKWNANESLIQWRDEGDRDPFGRLCRELGVSESGKDSFVWIYRNHFPDIQLTQSTQHSLALLEQSQAGIAILTDGRSVTQRLKLKALGLERFPVFISEDYGDAKPDTKRFEHVEASFQASKYCYVGDNPKKDFLAPNSLGWQTIGLVGSGKNTHNQSMVGLDASYKPDAWINHLSDLISA
ncbi:putative hydrolase of the HAD superfamily [Halospina denitrificans]|uniref:Putative hydrolase of the HAD superfamily n=1 Tax=Halospina denitrificans TaxID=332522 RepID=A0A4R7JZ20_9GAMM|nr:HAD family hydrolase [Halospina denitrificans]TDT43475.1 putative hydrolase of the HAD superfamily [Halospina denitrificans]